MPCRPSPWMWWARSAKPAISWPAIASWPMPCPAISWPSAPPELTASSDLNALPPVTVDVVGPVCETGDFLARDRVMANAMPGDFLAVRTAGAYGFVLSSNYNSRPRAPEVLVDGATWRIIRQRENYQDLVRGETL